MPFTILPVILLPVGVRWCFPTVSYGPLFQRSLITPPGRRRRRVKTPERTPEMGAGRSAEDPPGRRRKRRSPSTPLPPSRHANHADHGPFLKRLCSLKYFPLWIVHHPHHLHHPIVSEEYLQYLQKVVSSCWKTTMPQIIKKKRERERRGKRRKDRLQLQPSPTD